MTFRPGRELSAEFYSEAVRPLLADAFPGLRHSAGLFGAGSEVLGFDDERSTDHHWGPRLQVFVTEVDPRLRQVLAKRLPKRFRGYSTNFTDADPADGGVQLLAEIESGPVNHRVEVVTAAGFFNAHLGFDPGAAITLADWLLTPSQLLRTVAEGAIFVDELGILEPRRAAVAWYPYDLWIHLLGCQWARIGQEEHFLGRTGEVGDDLGSRLLAGRLVHDVMRLAFLLERRHAPYAKWFGSAFAQLAISEKLGPLLAAALAAGDWRGREAALSASYELAAKRFNELGVAAPQDPGVRNFHGRPFRVLDADRFAAACFAAIVDPAVRALDQPLGAVDQWADSTDLKSNPERLRRLGRTWG